MFRTDYCQSSGVLILYSQQLVFVILFMLTVCYSQQLVFVILADSQHTQYDKHHLLWIQF